MAAQIAQPPELRHVTSNNDFLTPTHTKEYSARAKPVKLSTTPPGQIHTPQRIPTRGSTEIPSSPSSIHSSNSAIFERDIEPLPATLLSTVESINGHVLQSSEASPRGGSPTHHHLNLNPQFIENSVPAVLDSAIVALADESKKQMMDPAAMNIAVISPAPCPVHASGALTPTHIGSPTGLRAQNLSRASKPRHASGPSGPSSVVGGSRSPSPTRRSFSVCVPTGPGQMSPGTQSPRILPERQNSQPAMPGAFGASSPNSSSSVNASPQMSPQMSPLSNIVSLSAQDSISLGPGTEMHDRSPSLSQGGLSPLINQASKRLSFVSYSDILTSAPLSAVPFSSIITSDEPPPHIPAVLGSSIEGLPASGSSVIGSEGGEWLGGEYEREGFGRGLEARLEAVLNKEQENPLPSSPEINVDVPMAPALS